VILARRFDDPPAYHLAGRLDPLHAHVTDVIASGVAPEIDDDALGSYLLRWEQWGALFKNIRPVLGGTVIEATPHGMIIERTFPRATSTEWSDASLDDLASQLRGHLLNAAASAVGSARRVGVLVGGVDSSGVLAALAQVISPDRILAMSITGEPGDGDTDPDIPYVEELCRHLGVRLLTDKWTPQTSRIEDALLIDCRPAFSSYQTPKRRWLESLAENGAEVVLTAAAGDAIFGGSFDELGTRILRAPVASIRALCGDMPWKPTIRERALWLVRRRLHRVPRSARLPRFYGARLRQRFTRRAPPASTPDARIRAWCTSPFVETAHLTNHALVQGFSIPHRDVALQEELVSFMGSVPIEAMNCDGRFRGLYHRAIAPWVTRRVAERRTKSYPDPFVNLLPSTAKALREYAQGTELQRRGWVDGARLLAEFDAGHVGAIWKFLTVEAWLRMYG
jgi:asparagine synthetase B (glutamine-hydrolysing)